MLFTCGADPEVFVKDTSSIRAICGKIGGTKRVPMPLPIGDGFGVQEDNVAMEFTIPPAASRESFINNIHSAMDFLSMKVNDLHGYSLDNRSAVSFPADELTHPGALVFGCDPDFNAWTGKRNPRPRARDRNLRSAGGHVHIGTDAKLTTEQKRSIIKACDLFLGVPSVIMDQGLLRKQLYGKAGAYRDKPYGVEYRTLSNFWVFDKGLTGWAFDQAQKALEFGLNNDVTSQGDVIQECINSNNVAMAHELVGLYGLEIA